METFFLQFGDGAVMVPRGVGCTVLLVTFGTVCIQIPGTHRSMVHNYLRISIALF